MSDMQSFSEKAIRQVSKEAAEWVVYLHDVDAPPSDLSAFVKWLKISPVHVREYLFAERHWLMLTQADRARPIDIDALLSDEDPVVVPLSAVMPKGANVRGGARRKRSWLPAWVAVAVAAVVATVLVVPLGMFFGEGEGHLLIETDLGEQRLVVLEDASVLELNTQSRVRVRYTESRRDVELLSGEAFFSVREDPDRIFAVQVDGHVVEVVGTSFNIYQKQDQTVISVLDGVVEVSQLEHVTGLSGSQAELAVLQLGFGDQAIIRADEPAVLHDAEAISRAVAWRERRVIFDNEPLEAVVAEFNRYNSRRIQLVGDTLTERRISGTFFVHLPETIVQFLERSDGIQVIEAADDGWTLVGT